MGTYYINNDELYHHGVLGMRWGIRRYQSYAENPKLSDRKKAKLAYKERKAANYKRYMDDISKIDKNDVKRAGEIGERYEQGIRENKAQYKAEKAAAKTKENHEKALKSKNAKELLKNKKHLTEEEFEKKANSIIMEAKLKEIANPKTTSVGKEAMKRVLTDAAVGAIKIGALVGAGYLVSKTPMGKEFVENAKGVFNSLKKVTKVGDAAKNVRAAAAKSDAGQAYVKTVQNIATAAKETRAAAAKSEAGQAYVKTVQKIANTAPVKSVAKDARDIRTRAAKSEAGQAYVNTINTALAKLEKGLKSNKLSPAQETEAKKRIEQYKGILSKLKK